MLMEGIAKSDTVSRNLPSNLGGEIDSIQKGSVLRLTDMESKPDGLWFFVGGSGWVDGKLIQITQDIEFNISARKMGLTKKGFHLFGNSGMIPIVGNGGITSGPITPTVGGGIMGRSSNGGAFGNSSGGGTIGDLGGAFGISMPGGALGDAIGSQSIESLSDGTFLSGVLGSLLGSAMSALDSLFSSFFQRLNFVVGFNASAILNLLGAPFGAGSISNSYTGTKLDVKSYGKPIHYRDVDIAAEHYFDYLGCGGKKKVHYVYDGATDDGKGYRRVRAYETDAYYNTPVLPSRQIPEEVNFHKEIYNNVYDDFQEALDKTKESLNLTISRPEWFINFNRWRLTHPDYHLTHSHQHIFMTRPDLNLFGSSYGSPSQSILSSPEAGFFSQALKRHQTLAMALSASMSGQHDFIPIIHNASRSFDVQDESLDTIEHGETLTGWKLVYAGNMIKSMTSGSFTINYVDDIQLSISYMHLIWLYYMNGVKRGIFEPKPDNIRHGILDYAASLYYIITDATDENIIFWTKYWGVFPTNYPSSAFSMSDGRPIAIPEIGIQYAYSFKKDMDPVCLAEFNRNSQGGNGNWNYVKPYNANTLHSTRTIVGSPFIDTNDGGYTYKLRFREP